MDTYAQNKNELADLTLLNNNTIFAGLIVIPSDIGTLIGVLFIRCYQNVGYSIINPPQSFFTSSSTSLPKRICRTQANP